jgi:hypothetical protein
MAESLQLRDAATCDQMSGALAGFSCLRRISRGPQTCPILVSVAPAGVCGVVHGASVCDAAPKAATDTSFLLCYARSSSPESLEAWLLLMSMPEKMFVPVPVML